MLLKKNKTGRVPPSHPGWRLFALIALALGSSAALQAATAPAPASGKIAFRALTPQEIHDFALPEGTQTSGGLRTVGIGSPIYLEAEVPKGTTVNGVTWAITKKPSESTAELQTSPIGREIPIYSPGDREIYSVAGRKLLRPDVAGQYTITAIVATPDGDITLTTKVTASTYIGVGILNKPNPDFPECALCHRDKANGWIETGHASMFTLAIDGLKSDHYNEDCISCHTLGFDPSPGAVNNGFDDVAEALNWDFPAELQVGNWLAMPDELKAKSNIQCENCHGPGSQHVTGDKFSTMAVSFDSGDCGQCHDEMPYHVKNQEWNHSRHSVATRYPTGEGRGSCVRCHSGVGFVDTVKGKETVRTDYEAITCAACHDPHDATNPHQVRQVSDVTLMNGAVVAAGGTGKLCMNCHMARRNAATYTEQYGSHYGPHYGPQTDMLAGTNAVDYGKHIPSSSHLYSVPDTCATCHMQSVARNDPAYTLAGGHTFKPVWDANTPDDEADDVDLVTACTQCHGPVTTFNFSRIDYDNDGVVEGVQSEVEGLMHDLAMLLPPLGQSEVEVTAEYTKPQLKAAYNYLFVEEDGSKGVHNTAYTVGILKASIADLGGTSGGGGVPGDSDNDGLPDEWENAMFGNLNQTGEGDSDNDGLTNAFEQRAGTNPTLADTDSDGFNDLAEVHANRAPLSANDTPNTESQIFHAAEFVFFTQAGKTYQVQVISELGTGGWVDISDPIQGTGDMQQVFISTRENGKEFFRVVELE